MEHFIVCGLVFLLRCNRKSREGWGGEDGRFTGSRFILQTSKQHGPQSGGDSRFSGRGDSHLWHVAKKKNKKKEREKNRPSFFSWSVHCYSGGAGSAPLHWKRLSSYVPSRRSKRHRRAASNAEGSQQQEAALSPLSFPFPSSPGPSRSTRTTVAGETSRLRLHLALTRRWGKYGGFPRCPSRCNSNDGAEIWKTQEHT